MVHVAFSYSYPAVLKKDEAGRVLVLFPAFPEAEPTGWTRRKRAPRPLTASRRRWLAASPMARKFRRVAGRCLAKFWFRRTRPSR